MPEPALRLSAVVPHRGSAVMPAGMAAGVTLDVAPGECVGLAGINGAGKTTLLKCLLDFMPLAAGRIAIFGLDHRRPAARAALAYLPERFQPPAYLTGTEWLRYTLALHGQRLDDRACAQMLAALQLDPAVLGHGVRRYSKGMTQKLGLAGCLLLDKQLYVLDEPASGLDPQARALFKAALRRRGNAGAAVLMTSHALADIDETCERIAILHDGALRFDGSPAACRARFGTATLEQAFLCAIGAAGPAS